MSRVTTILSIQSSVAYGHVGNSAVTFPLMRMGVEVWPVITVHFSNHTGYGAWRGPLLSAADLRDVVRGIDERGVLGEVDAVLSGYQGGEDIGEMILDAVAMVKRRNQAAIYCCDPVLGDTDRGLYVRPGIPELMRQQVVPAAQIITPNQFELESLTGLPVSTMAELLNAADAARSLGPDVAWSPAWYARMGRGGDQHGRRQRKRGLACDDAATSPSLHWKWGRHSGDVPSQPSEWDVPQHSPTAAVIYGLLEVTVASGASAPFFPLPFALRLALELALIAAPRTSSFRPQSQLRAATCPLTPVVLRQARTHLQLSPGRPRCWRPGHSACWPDPRTRG